MVWIFGFVTGFIGVVFFALGQYVLKLNEIRFKTHGVELTGKIVDIESRLNTNRDSDGHYHTVRMYRPIVSYIYKDIIYKTGSTVWSNTISCQIGDDMKIMINPDSPEIIMTEEDVKVFQLVGKLFSIIGGILLVISAIIFLGPLMKILFLGNLIF